MIKAVIFDCFGVLYTDGKSRIIDRCPVVHKQELGDLFMQADYGYITGSEFSASVAQLLGVDRSELDEMMQGMYARNEALVAYIRTLKHRYKIGVLSNVSAELFNDLFPAGLQSELFDHVTLSSQVGMIKPSPEIYRYTAEKIGIEPHEAVMIDDVERNVQGAGNVGMQGLLFRSTQQIIEDIDTILTAEKSHA